LQQRVTQLKQAKKLVNQRNKQLIKDLQLKNKEIEELSATLSNEASAPLPRYSHLFFYFIFAGAEDDTYTNFF
jgi:hypothetical protein